jgi:hypothetical protein
MPKVDTIRQTRMSRRPKRHQANKPKPADQAAEQKTPRTMEPHGTGLWNRSAPDESYLGPATTATPPRVEPAGTAADRATFAVSDNSAVVLDRASMVTRDTLISRLRLTSTP